MTETDLTILIDKARSLARELGKGTSLVSDPDISLAYYNEFKASTNRVLSRYEYLVAEVSKQKHLTHEIESIFDNFFVVEAALFEIGNNVRKNDFVKLPLTRSNRGKAIPRLYHILSKLVSETDRIVDKDIITQFLLSYQEHSPLSVRELSATPSILQIVFIEHFGKLIDKAINSLEEYGEAARISRKIKKEVSKKGFKDFSRIVSELVSQYSIVPLSLGFYLFQRLSADSQTMRPVLKWIKLNFEKQGIHSKNIADLESKQRSANSVAASHIIESLHWLTQVRWELIVEKINAVDAILIKDPAGAFAHMSMESKNYYRQIIVHIAETAGIHEAEVARAAIRLAQQIRDMGRPEAHVGYYLIDKGRKELEKKIAGKTHWKDVVYRFVIDHATKIYFGSLIGLNMILAAVFMRGVVSLGVSVVGFVLIGALVLFLNMEIILSFLNTFFARFLPVRKLMSLDLSKGISDTQRTFVVIPTMMRTSASIQETIRKLEVRYLGNKEDNILYAVLFDFKDSHQETLPSDKNLIDVAQKEIDVLNARYPSQEKKFYFLYRKRVWNPSEGKFMAWERKRGKLREFNMLLRGASGTTYVNEEIISSISFVRYVITLDEDTELPQDAARKLIGCIDHPLNRPVFDPHSTMLARGYGIIQPRAGVRIATAARSLYSSLFSAGSGIDSYSSAVSDVYQDLFGNALFFGKGIYDIDAVERTMEGQIPENTVLSHDLLEGIYARVGYASDIVLFDGFPKHYHEFAVRLHRWIRGDWQIMSWLQKVKNPLSSVTTPREFSKVDRFKIFDNLRRSLVPVAAVSLFVYGFIHPHLAVFLGIYVCMVLAGPTLIAFTNDLLSFKRIPLRIRVKDTLHQLMVAIAQTFLRLTFLLHHAYISVSAIIITCTRLFITKKHLLEWQNSTDASLTFTGVLPEFYRTMLVTQVVPIIYVLYGGYAAFSGSFTLIVITLWFVSPLIAYVISKPQTQEISFNKKEKSHLRSVAYRTSRFFLDLSRSETNWLIQDHYQEHPKIARTDRLTTSPTNLGMLFASLFSAYDLGYLPLDRFVDRTKKSFISLARLNRYKGHLYNWYDIETLEPLSPAYLSSVDSANFVMALIAFRQGIKELPKRPLVGLQSVQGLEDALYAVLEASRVFMKSSRNKAVKTVVESIARRTESLCNMIQNRMNDEVKKPRTFLDYYTFFTDIHPLVIAIEKTAIKLRSYEDVRDTEEIFFFVEHLAKHIESELAFERYLLPEVLSHDVSVDAYISRDIELSRIYQELIAVMKIRPSLHDIAYVIWDKVTSLHFQDALEKSSLSLPAKEYVATWYNETVNDLVLARIRAREFIADIESIERECNRFIDEPDFSFLYNKERGLFHIGYNVTYERIDAACYNFLASESNSVSFVAMYKNQVPQKHWFYLSRKLVRAGRNISLVSWGGSLFEYLTSLIYFKVHKESLLGATAQSAISVHKQHSILNDVPWGMGESAFYLFDAGNHYQYQVFGSPMLGLKRGLSDHMVIAPYVSALSLSFEPKASVSNMKKITTLGGSGNFGFYDALDYMNELRVKIKKPLPTKIYYAHHQGFMLLGIHNAIDKDRVRNLFHADPRVGSLEVLFEEKMPTTPAATTLSLPTHVPLSAVQGISDDGTESKQYVPARTPYPRMVFIGNGKYTTAVSNAGSGVSKYKDVSLTRYRDDALLEESGSFFYIKTDRSKTLWSPTLRPLGGDSKRHKVVFHENKAEFYTSNGSLHSKLEVAVDLEMPVEVRALTLSNKGDTPERVTVASYGEVSLATQVQDMHHPLYQRMLVSSVFVPEINALVYSRPHPDDRNRTLYFAHTLAQKSMFHESISVCADRELFIGRSRSLRDPIFFDRSSDEPVREYTLDPIFSISRTIVLKPGETERFVYINATSEDYQELMNMLRRFKKGGIGMNVISRAISKSAQVTKELGITQEMAIVFQELASRACAGKQSGLSEMPYSELPYIHSLWKLGISGDRPIVVMKIRDIEDLQTVKQALLCQTYWKYKGIEIDLVILNQEPSSYIKVLDDEIDFLLRQNKWGRSNVSGSSIHQVKSDLTEDIDRMVLLHVARVVLDSKDGTFKQQVKIALRSSPVHKYPTKYLPAARTPRVFEKLTPHKKTLSRLSFKNTWGGFDIDSSEYVMELTADSLPKAPWVNIIAQPDFGALVTESGSMFTWSKDSYDNRITAWSNDTVVFRSSEIFYIRDEETGEIWNPTPLPVRSKQRYTVRHGKGYSIFEHSKDSLDFSFRIAVSPSRLAKTAVLKVHNTGSRSRTLSETVFLDPSLNVFRDHTRDFIHFERDTDTGALFFEQKFRKQLPHRIAFADLHNGSFDITTDKIEFLGRHGSLESPAALKRITLSNRITASTTNCIALQSMFTLNPGEEKEIAFILGDASHASEARMTVCAERLTDTRKEDQSITDHQWESVLSKVQIETPDKALDALFNHQLLYQVLSARIWAKTGFYQPSGAFGFRDQLQDMTAFLWSKPQDVRAFILKAAAHQFKEGDVLNWWHDHNKFGSRSVLSDHQLWLVYATLEYISVTGDESILDEHIVFLEGPQLSFSHQQEWAGTPEQTHEIASLYEHCVRAIEKSMVFGSHELPLMGRSDWNDGLSKVGILGKGESVWMGWFLGHIIDRFKHVSEKRGDSLRVNSYVARKELLEKALEKHAWDGRWYKRAFMDSGMALGSRKLNEFKIDSIAQSWAVISGIARPDRAIKAMESAFSELYDGVTMKLLTPALKNSFFDPGYVKDYPAGVRENGSQYNHAALWSAQAMFMIGEPDKGKKILDLVNPFKRTDSSEKASAYRVEPYVVASDVYAEPSYKGRGGWTWYTGSAGVMYRTILRSLMGLVVEGSTLSFKPSLPTEWRECSITYMYGSTAYVIQYEKPKGVHRKVLKVSGNDVSISDNKLSLVDDGKHHEVKVILGTEV